MRCLYINTNNRKQWCVSHGFICLIVEMSLYIVIDMTKDKTLFIPCTHLIVNAFYVIICILNAFELAVALDIFQLSIVV